MYIAIAMSAYSRIGFLHSITRLQDLIASWLAGWLRPNS